MRSQHVSATKHVAMMATRSIMYKIYNLARHKSIIKRITLPVSVFLAAAFCFTPPASGHIPHDVIGDIAISPNFMIDNVVYSIVRNDIFKSNDRGLTWRRLTQGIDTASAPNAVAIASKLPSTLFISSNAGIYKSENAGTSWHHASHGLDTMEIGKLYIPSTASGVTHIIVFATGTKRALYKTVNGGNNWRKMYDDPVPVSAIAGFGWNTKGSGKANIVLIGDKNGNLLRTNNGGKTWNNIHKFSRCGEITSIAASKGIGEHTFFIGTSKCGVYRTFDAGMTFKAINAGITDLNIRSVVMSPNYAIDTTVMASTWSEGVFISANEGSSWAKYSAGLTTAPQAAKYGDPNFRDIRISPDFANDKLVFLAGFDGLFISSSGGTQWKELTTLRKSLVMSLAIPPNYPTDATIFISTYGNRFYGSRNDGVTWKKLAIAAGRGQFRGYDVAFSPNYLNDGTMFATIADYSVMKSTDRGITWVQHKIPRGDEVTLIAISPEFATDRTLFVATRAASIYKSTDAGETFVSVADKLDGSGKHSVSSLAISPDYVNDHTVIATLSSGGVYLSSDAGATWFLKSSHSFGGLPKVVMSPNYKADRTIFIGGLKGLFLTTNEFGSWKKISCDVCGVDGYVVALAVSPNYKKDKTLAISVEGKGLYKSKNRGLTFKPFGSSLIRHSHVFSLYKAFPLMSQPIVFSPKYATDKTIFGNSSDGIYRSRNGGITWNRVAADIHFKQPPGR